MSVQPSTHNKFLDYAVQRRLAAGAVILSQFFFRVAFLSLSVNLVFFLHEQPYSWTSINAMLATLLFHAAAYLPSVLGGWLADAFFNRFKTALLGYAVAGLVYPLFPLMYHEAYNGGSQDDILGICPLKGVRNSSDLRASLDMEPCAVYVCVALVCLGLATAAIWAVMAPFLADQCPDAGQLLLRRLFTYYFFALNAGALVAVLVMTFIQQNINMFWGYMAPYAGLLASGLCLLLARPILIIQKPHGSPLNDTFGVLWSALRTSCRRRMRGNNELNESINSESNPFAVSLITRYGTDGSALEETEALVNNLVPSSFLDRAKVRLGGLYREEIVDDVKATLRVVLVLACLEPFWCSYFQMETTFLVQGLHMNLYVGDNIGIKIPPAWLSLFNILIIIVLIPVLTHCVYPLLDRRDLAPSLKIQMRFGMLMAGVAMAVAGMVEHFRLQVFWGADNPTPYHPRGKHEQKIGNTTYKASDMSIAWQIPQYLMMGIAEVFTTVACLNFVCSHAPRRMQALATGFFYFFTGLGSLLGAAFLWIFSQHFYFNNTPSGINHRRPCKDDPNKTCKATRLDYFFYFLAAFQLIGIISHAIVMHCAFARPRCQRPRRLQHLERENTVPAAHL